MKFAWQIDPTYIFGSTKMLSRFSTLIRSLSGTM